MIILDNFKHISYNYTRPLDFFITITLTLMMRLVGRLEGLLKKRYWTLWKCQYLDRDTVARGHGRKIYKRDSTVVILPEFFVVDRRLNAHPYDIYLCHISQLFVCLICLSADLTSQKWVIVRTFLCLYYEFDWMIRGDLRWLKKAFLAL